MRIFLSISSLALACVLGGCNSFPGIIAFRNHGHRPVWVEHVQGFKHTPPAGILSPGSSADSFMGSMPLPKEIVLVWSLEWHKADRRSVVLLPQQPLPAADAELQILFSPQEEWTAQWRKRGEWLQDKEPNKAPEPTSCSVTSRAILPFLELKRRNPSRLQARAAPEQAVAHL